MNTIMYLNPITEEHIKELSKSLCIIIPVAKKLACGDIGIGGLPTAEFIHSTVTSSL